MNNLVDIRFRTADKTVYNLTMDYEDYAESPRNWGSYGKILTDDYGIGEQGNSSVNDYLIELLAENYAGFELREQLHIEPAIIDDVDFNKKLQKELSKIGYTLLPLSIDDYANDEKVFIPNDFNNFNAYYLLKNDDLESSTDRLSFIKAELKTFNQYLSGQVYRYNIEKLDKKTGDWYSVDSLNEIYLTEKSPLNAELVAYNELDLKKKTFEGQSIEIIHDEVDYIVDDLVKI